jgi:hypothetical protein
MPDFKLTFQEEVRRLARKEVKAARLRKLSEKSVGIICRARKRCWTLYPR